MDITHCVSIFNQLKKDFRLKAISKLMDTIGPKDMEVVLGTIDHHLEGDDENENTTDIKNKVVGSLKTSMNSTNQYQEAATNKRNVNFAVDETRIKRLGRPRSKLTNATNNYQEAANNQRNVNLAADERRGRPRSKLTGLAIIPCLCCTEKFATNMLLKNHMLKKHKHSDKLGELQGVVTCPCCGKKFSKYYRLKLHMHNKHKDSDKLREVEGKVKKRVVSTKNICEICGEEFKVFWLLRRHIAVDHEHKRMYVCNVCQKTFKRNVGLKNHILLHQDRGFSCTFCGKQFRRADHLLNHKRRAHTGERPFKCEKCDWSGADSSSLIHHKKKQFRRADHLLNHKRRAHTGERPFKCEKCDWSGADSSSLIHHKKKHKD